MYTDAQNLFSDAQALTGTAVSTNVIDLGSDRNVGQGEPLAVVLVTDVSADFASANETYQIDLETDDNVGFSSAVVISRRIPAAAILLAGSKLVMPIPHDNERYLRLNYTLGGTTPSWTVTAFVVPMSMIQADEKYPDAITIS